MSAFKEQLDRMEKKLDRLDRMEKKLDLIDLRTAALVEWAYRSRHPFCDFKEIVSAEDAVRLLSTPGPGSVTATVIAKNVKMLTEHLYRNETRKLLALICPDRTLKDKEEQWEKKAYALLEKWIGDNSNMKESEIYAEKSKWVVAKNFADLLKPFATSNGSTNSLHETAKGMLRDDKSGLTLSLILAHEKLQSGDEGKPTCWAWRELDFDGYEINDHAKATIVTEVKSSEGGLSTAKKQLKLRARFLDVVASCVDSTEIQFVCLVAAILKSSSNEAGDSEEQLDAAPYTKIKKLTLKTEYFRL